MSTIGKEKLSLHRRIIKNFILLMIVPCLALVFSSCQRNELYDNEDKNYFEVEIINLRNGLVVEYLFNGNADDTSGNGINGAVFGATLATDRFGTAGAAYNFIETNFDYIDCGNSALTAITGAISIAVWVRIGNLGNSHEIIGRGHAQPGAGYRSGYALSYLYTSGQIIFDTGDSTGMVRDALGSTVYITDNAWHFIVATWDGTTNSGGKRIYVDGLQAGEKACTLAQTGYNATAEYLNIGRHPDSAWTYYDGDIDDVRVYDRDLSAVEVDALYHENGY